MVTLNLAQGGKGGKGGKSTPRTRPRRRRRRRHRSGRRPDLDYVTATISTHYLLSNRAVGGNGGSGGCGSTLGTPGTGGQADGGGLYTTDGGTVTLNTAYIAANFAQGGNGGLTGAHGSGAGGNALGAGVYVAYGTLNLTSTWIYSNIATAGLSYLGATAATANGGGIFEGAGSTVNLVALDYIFGNLPNNIGS